MTATTDGYAPGSASRKPGPSRPRSHASAVPSTTAPAPTPASRASVLTTSSGSCVSQRWLQTSVRGAASDSATESTGTATGHAIARAVGVHQPAPQAGRSVRGTARLLVADAVGETNRRRLELAGRRDVD